MVRAALRIAVTARHHDDRRVEHALEHLVVREETGEVHEVADPEPVRLPPERVDVAFTDDVEGDVVPRRRSHATARITSPTPSAR
jgi:hypothetical protein